MRRGEAMWPPQSNDGPLHRRGRRMLLDTAGFFRDGYFSNSPNEAVIIFCLEKVF